MKRHATRNDAGFVLVTVLWILAILTVISLGFARRSMLERQAVWYALDHQQAMHMARGGVERGILGLRLSARINQHLERDGYTGLNQQWAREVNLLTEADYYATSSDPSFREELCELKIRDCESRIAVNYVPEELLRNIEGLDPKVVRAIMDRRSFNRDSEQPWRISTLDEIRLLGDIPDETWYGESPGDGLRDLFTVWGDSNGGAININTASAAVLRAVPGTTDEVVEAIVAYRAGEDGVAGTSDDGVFRSVREVVSALDLSAESVQGILRQCKPTSSTFDIEAHATRRRGKVNAYCVTTVHLLQAQIQILEWKERANEF